MQGRFQSGISLTGPKARTVMGTLVGGVVLLLRFDSGSGLVPHTTPVLRLHYTGNCSMASYGFGVHIYCAHHSGICETRLHCNPTYAWVVLYLV